MNHFFLFCFLCCSLVACNQTQKKTSSYAKEEKEIHFNKKSSPMTINWNELPTEGLKGNLKKGVSASYSAIINNELLVAGGCNFPDKLGFEGGKKVFYKEVLWFNSSENKWQVIGQLPKASAYGVSVAIPSGTLWIGGNTETESLATCYKVSFSEKHELQLTDFPSLPFPMDNFAGCSLGSKVFVGGGVVDGKPSKSVYYIDVKTDKEWKKLPDFIGNPRVQPVMAAIEENGTTKLYVLGGFFGGNTSDKPSMATEVLCFDFSTQQWEVVGNQLDEKTKKPFSLGGSTAFSVENRYIVCFGGVNYEVFLKAITELHSIANDASLTEEERKEKNYQFSKNYMTQPVDYYKFNTECRVFDTQTKQWLVIDNQNHLARAGATLIGNENQFFLVQGEEKPGVRNPKTWKGQLKISN